MVDAREVHGAIPNNRSCQERVDCCRGVKAAPGFGSAGGTRPLPADVGRQTLKSVTPQSCRPRRAQMFISTTIVVSTCRQCDDDANRKQITFEKIITEKDCQGDGRLAIEELAGQHLRFAARRLSQAQLAEKSLKRVLQQLHPVRLV